MTKKVRLLLTGFRQRHPSLALRLSEHKSSLPALEEVRRRAADLALISGPIPRGLSGRLVDTRRWVMVIPPGHRLFARERIARGDLDGEDVYTFQRSVRPTTFDLLRGFLRREHPGCTLHSPAREFDAAASAFYATGRASLLCMEDYCQSNRDWREVPFDAGDAPLTTIYLVGKEPLLLAAARALARHLAPG